MAYFRLWRRVRIAPGLTVNLSKRGASISVGVRGAHVTLGRRGVRKTVGIPGTGMFITDQKPWKTARPSTHRVTTAAELGDRLASTGSRVTWDGHDVTRADMPEIKAYYAEISKEAEKEAEELGRTNPAAAAEARAVISAFAGQLSAFEPPSLPTTAGYAVAKRLSQLGIPIPGAAICVLGGAVAAVAFGLLSAIVSTPSGVGRQPIILPSQVAAPARPAYCQGAATARLPECGWTPSSKEALPPARVLRP